MASFGMHAQDPLFDASTTITAYGSVSSPSAEQYFNIIDGDIETKFLDFNYFDGLGFTVNLEGYQTVVTSMDFTTANDSPERDPTVFEIFGSNDGTYFTSIIVGDIVCDPERFYTTSYIFDNTEAYSYYRFVFSAQCNTIEAMIQIAEVQLYGTALARKDFVKTELKLFPNPNNGNFTISQNEAIGKVVITDALGKIVKQLDLENSFSHQIDMQGVESGLYFVKTTTGSTQKLIIK